MRSEDELFRAMFALRRLAVLDDGPMECHGDVKEIGDRIMDGSEKLKLSCRLEALHDRLSSLGPQVGILRPIVQVLMRALLDIRHDLPLCFSIGSKFIGDYPLGSNALLLEKPYRQTPGGLGIATVLQNVACETTWRKV